MLQLSLFNKQYEHGTINSLVNATVVTVGDLAGGSGFGCLCWQIY